MRERFLLAARTENIAPGRMKRVELEGRRILIANVAGRYCAADDACTHEDASLSSGVLHGTVVRCPLHGARFDVCSGAALEEPAEQPLRTYPVRVHDGCVLVDIDAPAGK